MKLRIANKSTIHELQKQFSKAFPFLKIEFFDIHSTGSLAKVHMYNANKTLAACRSNKNEGPLEVKESDTVGALKKQLWDQYGLSAEVFRKSGNVWIETSLSNSWTLKLQNDEGKVFSDMFKGETKDEDITDRDIWE